MARLDSGWPVVKFVCSLLVFFPHYFSCAALADVKSDLELLRDRCLFFSVGHAPNDEATQTIRHDLYAQSPFSPPGEIDIAASGLALAALPAAVENNLITRAQGGAIAEAAGQRIRQLVEKSANSTTPADYGKYGYKGMLFHYYTWSDSAGEFQGKAGTEVSSIDTTLLMYGFLVSAHYFQGTVQADYEAARDLISWKDWLDSTTPGHVNQFRQAFKDGAFLDVWWDWRSEETMLICLFALMSDSSLDKKNIWNGWIRKSVKYVSPLPDSQTFSCYATWNGDPFTVFYGLHFFRFRKDINETDWFEESRTAYRGHVEFFRKEKGFLDNMTLAFSLDPHGTPPVGAIAEPKASPDPPVSKTYCPIYSLAGGLEYYASSPAENELARTLSALVAKGNSFWQWTGWPPDSVRADTVDHAVYSDRIIGQNLASIAIAIENYLTGGIRKYVLEDAAMAETFNALMPPPSGGQGRMSILHFFGAAIVQQRDRAKNDL